MIGLARHACLRRGTTMGPVHRRAGYAAVPTVMVVAKAGTVKAEEMRNDRRETVPVIPTVGFGQPGVMPGRSRRPRFEA